MSQCTTHLDINQLFRQITQEYNSLQEVKAKLYYLRDNQLQPEDYRRLLHMVAIFYTLQQESLR